MKFASAALLATLLACPPAQAAEPVQAVTRGVGAQGCYVWLSEREGVQANRPNSGMALHGTTSWIMGYMSAFNVQAAVASPGSEIEMPTPELVTFMMDKKCRDDPQLDIASAALGVWVQIRTTARKR